MQRDMSRVYIRLLSAIFITAILAGCREDMEFVPDEAARGESVPVNISVDVADCDDTRGVLSESKTEFDSNELIHIRAEFLCEEKDAAGNVLQERKDVVYTALKCSYSTYSDKRYNIQWTNISELPALMWPDDAKTGTFTAYYIAGSSGALSSNQMESKLLSEYKASEVPMCAEVKNVAYGQAVRLSMKRMFSFLTLTDIQEGVSDDLWFTVQNDEKFNNAFRLLFNESTKEITPDFCRVGNNYTDDSGKQLIVVEPYNRENREDVADDGSAAGVSYFLEPRVYTQFSILYPRSRSEYATYLTYNNDLSKIISGEGNEEGAFLPNGRYVFSILKSLGVVVETSPDDGWDKTEPTVDIDVESFLRAVHSGSDYFEVDEETDDKVQILESTSEGTRLLRNVSFHNEYYDVFRPGTTDEFRPTLNNTFDGNYHYIYDMSCPLFYENNGNIINLGIRDAKTNDGQPVVSCEAANQEYGAEMSHNGIIASNNNGVVDNVRVVNVDMTVHIMAFGAGEAHDVSLLFGVNNGRVYDVGLAGEFNLTVRNASDGNMMPKVTIGGLAGQNIGTIRGISYIEDEKENFKMPTIKITNECQGANGAYWVGGMVGSNMGNLEDIFIPSVEVDATRSIGVGSYIGGMVGESPNSSSGAPSITGCIVRGGVAAGRVSSLTNISAYSYTGGVAGSLNLHSNIDNCSVSVGVTDSTDKDDRGEYGQGGAFGVIQLIPEGLGLQEGTVRILSCYGQTLEGNGYVGNFAGIVPKGYGWEYYENNRIDVKQYGEMQNIGFEREN